MDEIQLCGFEKMAEWWAEIVLKLRDSLFKKPEPSDWMRTQLRSELRVYGLCLAHARDCIEAERGIENTARVNAGTEYWLAMKDLTETLALPEDGCEFDNTSSAGISRISQNRADRIKKAEMAVDEALIWYAAPAIE